MTNKNAHLSTLVSLLMAYSYIALVIAGFTNTINPSTSTILYVIFSVQLIIQSHVALVYAKYVKQFRAWVVSIILAMSPPMLLFFGLLLVGVISQSSDALNSSSATIGYFAFIVQLFGSISLWRLIILTPKK